MERKYKSFDDYAIGEEVLAKIYYTKEDPIYVKRQGFVKSKHVFTWEERLMTIMYVHIYGIGTIGYLHRVDVEPSKYLTK